MNILIAATELSPYVSESPAAVAISSLTKALRLLGHEVTLVLPRFGGFEAAGLMLGRRLTPLSLGGGAEALLYEATLSSGARLLLIDSAEAAMESISSGDSGAALALGRFTDGVAALVNEAQAPAHFDVVHVHGAQAGLALLKMRRAGSADVGRVLTVHDAQELGVFPLDQQENLGIPEIFAGQQGFKSGDELSLLKGVLSLADVVVAPSESYATELLAAERFGPISRSFRGQAPIGILGGVDHAIYNPATDSALACRYDAQDPSNKGRCRSSLLKELGLPVETQRPLVFYEELGADGAGIETLLGAAPALARLDITLILHSTRELSAPQTATVEALSGQVLVLNQLETRLRRRLLSAADFYLCAERHNPSGQHLLQAARYGAVPVALAVDAAKDVVVDADAELVSGTGLLFDSFSQRALLAVLGRAVAAYRRPNFVKLLSRVMRQDWAWDRPARRHLQVYRQAAGASH